MFTYRDVLDSDGLIARLRPGYERRPAQLAMAAEVDAAIRKRTCLAVEAGTGVGKSFAYLVPSILYVVEDQVRAYNKDDYFEIPDEEASSESQSLDEAHESARIEDAPPDFAPSEDDRDSKPDASSFRRIRSVSRNNFFRRTSLF